MSKTQQVIELVGEINELEARLHAKRSKLAQLVGEAPNGKAKAKAESEADLGWDELILNHLNANRGEACKASDIRDAVGCSDQVLYYHMKALIEAKRVKRVKMGHYQIRGRR